MANSSPGRAPRSIARIAIVFWGVGGVVALLVQAIWRLTPRAMVPLEEGMTGGQWLLFVGWVLVNGYAEGYRSIQRSFAPRVVVRAFRLAERPRALHVALAPAFCMSLFSASRRGLIVAWCVVGGVAALVAAVRMIPQPWRGIVDAGVVVGLAWGTMALVVYLWRALAGVLPNVTDDLPAPTA